MHKGNKICRNSSEGLFYLQEMLSSRIASDIQTFRLKCYAKQVQLQMGFAYIKGGGC